MGREKPVKSKASPVGGNRGCLCPDNTDHKDCCNGDMYAQGVGSLVNQGSVTIDQTIVNRVINNSHG